MKTLLILGATLIVLDTSSLPASAQTASASPAATVSHRPSPGTESPAPRPTPADRPYSTGSPATSRAATSSPSSTQMRDAGITPAATASPGGGTQLEGESSHLVTQESSPKPAISQGMITPTASRPHRKLERREGHTPQEKSGEQR
jgi:hypothetical protein